MSEEDRQNFSEKDHGSDNKQIENLEVGNIEANLDNTIEVVHNSSGISHHMLQQNAEVNAIKDEEIPHQLLAENFNENFQSRVIECPSDNEAKTDGDLSQVSVDTMDSIRFQAIPQELHENSFIKKQKDELIEVVDSESLNKNDPGVSVTCTTVTWRDAERKRKAGQISVMQNKRPKELPNALFQCPSAEGNVEVQSQDSSSCEFDVVEDSVLSNNNSSKSGNETSKQMTSKDLSSDTQQAKERKDESFKKKKSEKVESGCFSHPNSSQNNQFDDKIEEKSLFRKLLRGDTFPAFKLTDEDKKKFESSLPTVFEVRESDSDENIPQQLQSEEANSLKMKAVVGKRKDKCNICNARLGLCAIKCRCGGYYCAKHRYDREHNCPFDYKTMGAAEIKKNNPRIVAEKIRKL